MAASDAAATIEGVLERYLERLMSSDLRIDQVYLFGSFAVGTPHQWSDIDLAVVSPDFTDDVIENDMRLARLTWDVDVRIEPHAFRPEDFTPDNPWVAEILRSGIRIT